MSKPYIVTFVRFDDEDSWTEVQVEGELYEPAYLRQSLVVETVGPFKTKREAQAYAKRYDGYAAQTLIRELDDPKDE